MERMVDFMLKAINIKWDTDGDMEVLNELPTEVTIPENTEEEDICDYLSDEYGYCVFGFDVVTVKGFRGLFINPPQIPIRFFLIACFLDYSQT